MRQKISMVTLGVASTERSALFFEAGLGWKRHKSSQGQIVFFDLGGTVLSLYPRKALAADTQTEDAECGFRAVSLSFNARDRNEVDEVMREAEKAGAKIVKKAEEVFWGGYSGYFADPDGHLFEVAHNPFWEINDRGDIELPA